jgi:hypothetical protein
MAFDLKRIEKGLADLDKHIRMVTNGKVGLGPDGQCVLQWKSIIVYIVAVPPQDLVIFKTFINFLPDSGTGMILPLYYHLLDMNDETETGFAYFAIVSGGDNPNARDVISVEVKRPISDISFDEFMGCLASVGEVSNRYIVKLQKEFQAPPVP